MPKKPSSTRKARSNRSNRTSPESSNPAKVTRRAKLEARVTSARYAIVGIGASAGGLKALEGFFDHVPPRSGLAFVVVTHQQAGHGGLLRGLLQKHTEMQVLDVVDGIPVKPNAVYVAPAAQVISLLHGTLYVTEPTTQSPVRMPIDAFFRSLAQDQNHRAIGIVLSGAGTDGTLGLRAIKGEAGFTVAQSPEEAEYSGMPQSAVTSKSVDCLLPVGDMPGRILDYVKKPPESPALGEPEPEVDQTLPKILAIVRSRTGNDFSHYKPRTILRRIERRMNLHGLETLQDYLRSLHDDAHEAETLAQELLIGVTSFFRDPQAFTALWRKGIAPILKGKPKGYTLRIWVPGCSTGEEAYSLAILLKEQLGLRKHRPHIQIFATDLDKHSIALARAGFFPAGIANDVPASTLHRFFIKEETGYRIKTDIRNQIVFAPHNLLTDPPFARLDVVSCRNLLIYLESETQRRLLICFHSALKPKGVLFLGSSETVSAFDELFTSLDRKRKVFGRREVDRALFLYERVLSQRTGSARSPAPLKSPGPSLVRRQPGARDTASIDAMLMDRFVPASVITNDRGEIMFIHGRTGRYLEPAPGIPTRNIVDMARQGLRPHLASALLQLKGKRSEVTTNAPGSRATAGRNFW